MFNLSAFSIFPIFFRKNKKLAIALIVNFIIWQTPALIFPIFIGMAVDIAIQKGGISNFTGICLALCGCYLVAFFSRLKHLSTLSFVSRTVGARIKRALCESALRGDCNSSESVSFGKMASKLSDDIRNIESFPKNVLDDAMYAISFVVISLAVISYWAPWLLSVLLVVLPFSIILNITLSKRMDNISLRHRLQAEGLSQNIFEFFNMSKWLALHQTGSYLFGRIGAKIDRVARIGTSVDRARGFFKTFSWLGLKIFEITSIVFLIMLVTSGKIAVGQMSTLIYYVCGLAEWILWIISLSAEFSQTRDSINSIQAVINEDQSKRNDDVINSISSSGLLDIRRISFVFPSNKSFAIKDVSFQVPVRNLTCLIGPSGSGKTTLLKILISELAASDGDVFLDDVSLRRVLTAYRRKMAFVPQNSAFISGTIRLNITLGEALENRDLASSISNSKLSEVLDGLPLGIDTKIGEGGMHLSAGQYQRLAIARALARSPSYLFLDEPTSNLDPETEGGLIAQLKLIARKQTTVVATHSVPLMLAADNLIVIEGGRVKSIGSPRDLIQSDGYFKNLYDMAFGERR